MVETLESAGGWRSPFRCCTSRAGRGSRPTSGGRRPWRPERPTASAQLRDRMFFWPRRRPYLGLIASDFWSNRGRRTPSTVAPATARFGFSLFPSKRDENSMLNYVEFYGDGMGRDVIVLTTSDVAKLFGQRDILQKFARRRGPHHIIRFFFHYLLDMCYVFFKTLRLTCEQGRCAP